MVHPFLFLAMIACLWGVVSFSLASESKKRKQLNQKIVTTNPTQNASHSLAHVTEHKRVYTPRIAARALSKPQVNREYNWEDDYQFQAHPEKTHKSSIKPLSWDEWVQNNKIVIEVCNRLYRQAT